MNSKNVKVVDEHNIDRNANVMFAFELEGSGYVSYSIERDEENSNIFVSKVLRNLDGTFNMVDIDDTMEKTKLVDIIKKVITNAVESQQDKMYGNSVTLADGKVIKFMTVVFNKEQRINVQKTYITTVKKEVVRVAEKYYAIDVVVEQPSVVENIFPTVTPVVEPVKEEVLPEIPVPVVETQTIPVLSTPVVEVPKVEPQVLPTTAPVSEPVKEIIPEVAAPVQQPAPVVVEPITVATPEPVVVTPIETEKVAEPTVVVPTPVPAAVPNNTESQPLVFNASKETNLNAALGEVANSTAIPVENIEPVREFGVETPVNPPVVNAQPVVAPMPQTEDSSVTSGGAVSSTMSKKGGFANGKFFMVVSIAFFLASCVFLGYEVFNYFQLTK